MILPAIGRRHWAVSAGHAPSHSSGIEPLFTSCDQICLLNAGDRLANVRITVVYADCREIGPFRIGIAARRVRHIRVNDFIFPEAVRLDEAYGLIIASDEPVVCQFSRRDTRQVANAGLMATAWAD